MLIDESSDSLFAEDKSVLTSEYVAKRDTTSVHETRKYDVSIQSGQLQIVTTKEHVPLVHALDFSSRENMKRKFHFSSRLMGKYIPIRPLVLRSTGLLLAELIGDVEGPIVSVGMAEVATGLGNCVHDCLTMINGDVSSVYIHTTRYTLDHPVAFNFEESHSHAVDQALHMPLKSHHEPFLKAKTLCIVDDEITTGHTAAKFVTSYLKLNPNIERIIFVTIVDWMSESLLNEVKKVTGRDVEVVSLIDGEFNFTPNSDYIAKLPPSNGYPVCNISGNPMYGRLGITRYDIELNEYLRSIDGILKGKVLILGTGEFMYMPFLLAEQLEQMGLDVLFLSTARSPLAFGDAIQSKIVFPCHHGEGVPNYLYNMPQGRTNLIGYESDTIAHNHVLPSQLNAHVFGISNNGNNGTYSFYKIPNRAVV